MHKIIFFDIDGTLMGNGTERNLRRLGNYLSGQKKKGVVFGINTNRPWTEAVGVYKEIGLSGPIILEDGAVYRLNDKSAEKVVNYKAKNLNKKITDFLKKNLSRYLPGMAVISGRDKSLLKNRTLVFISKDRRYTSSIYVSNKGGILGSKRDFNLILKLLRKKFNRNKFLNFKGNPENGKIIASNGFSDRISTMQRVGRRYFSDYKIFLISDDEVPRREMGATFCGVKNATKEYKKRCEIVTKIAGWRGIKDLVEKIINNTNGARKTTC